MHCRLLRSGKVEGIVYVADENLTLQCMLTKIILRSVTVHLMKLIGASVSEPHTSVTALRDACVCMSVCGHIPKIKFNKGISTLHTCSSNSWSMQVDTTIDPSLSNSTLIY